ncbi:MAG: hypothetical protein J7J54_00270, partial [Candidatus Omnitrophica bacterium]|nr:hypothetical protein [Candidatus Omnitrophota bacterium]
DDEIEAVDELVNLFKKEEVEELLSMMDERSRQIIRMRFGLDTGLPRTLAEVARKFKITRERVRQIEKEALAKMREILLGETHSLEEKPSHSLKLKEKKRKKFKKEEITRKKKGKNGKRPKRIRKVSGKRKITKKKKSVPKTRRRKR